MIYYVAHPLGTGYKRYDNVVHVKQWLKFLLKKYPDDSFMLPWALYAEVLPETEENRARGMRDDLRMLQCCNGIVLCGEVVSPGMLTELVAYTKRQAERGLELNILNFVGTRFPPADPPQESTDEDIPF